MTTKPHGSSATASNPIESSLAFVVLKSTHAQQSRNIGGGAPIAIIERLKTECGQTA